MIPIHKVIIEGTYLIINSNNINNDNIDDGGDITLLNLCQNLVICNNFSVISYVLTCENGYETLFESVLFHQNKLSSLDIHSIQSFLIKIRTCSIKQNKRLKYPSNEFHHLNIRK